MKCKNKCKKCIGIKCKNYIAHKQEDYYSYYEGVLHSRRVKNDN